MKDDLGASAQETLQEGSGLLQLPPAGMKREGRGHCRQFPGPEIVQAPQTQTGDWRGDLIVLDHQGKLMAPGVRQRRVGKEAERLVVTAHGIDAGSRGLAIETVRADADSSIDLDAHGQDQRAKSLFGKFAGGAIAKDSYQGSNGFHQVGNITGLDGRGLQALDALRGCIGKIGDQSCLDHLGEFSDRIGGVSTLKSPVAGCLFDRDSMNECLGKSNGEFRNPAQHPYFAKGAASGFGID